MSPDVPRHSVSKDSALITCRLYKPIRQMEYPESAKTTASTVCIPKWRFG
jgi:hypothetical protein